MPFSGPVIPFGAMVEYHPISAHFSRGRIWKGDIMVADIEELEEMDASTRRMHLVLTRKNNLSFS